MSTQLAPPALQRRHWYVYVIGSVPVQVPVSTLSVSPSCALPLTTGAATECGGSAVTTAPPEGTEVACALPAVLVAWTETRTWWPMSAPVRL